MIVLDTETTGLDTEKDRIVQFAAKDTDDGVSIKININPGVAIPAEASAIHGLTNEMLVDCQPFADVADDILMFLGSADLAGHNILGLDLPMLIAEFRRCGQTLDLENRLIIDTMVVFREEVPHTLEGALHYYCDEEIENAHDALGDVEATSKVLAQMIQTDNAFEKLSRISMGNRVTIDGKIISDDKGQACLSFGKFKGRPLADVARIDPGYLRWMLGQSFSGEAMDIVRGFLGG